MEENTNYIVLSDEEGNEMEFFILAMKEHENRILMLAADSEDDDAEVTIFSCTSTDGDDMIITPIEPEEFEDVLFLFKDQIDEYDIDIL